MPQSAFAENGLRFCLKLSFDRIRAELFTAALCAKVAAPYPVELFRRHGDKPRIVCENAGFEVPVCGGFHADARARQVRGPDVGDFLIKDKNFEMHSGAKRTFQAGD